MTAPHERRPITEKLRADVAELVRSTRKDRRVSQQALGFDIGISRTTISRIENGRLDDLLLGSVAAVLAWCGFELSVTVRPRRPSGPVGAVEHDRRAALAGFASTEEVL